MILSCAVRGNLHSGALASDEARTRTASTIAAMQSTHRNGHGDLPVEDPPPSGEPEEQAPVKDPSEPGRDKERKGPPR